jgi:hypothetical protein
MRFSLALAVMLVACGSSGGRDAAVLDAGVDAAVEPADTGPPDAGPPDAGPPPPAWLMNARILVPGVGLTNHTCTDGMVCPHSENTDLINFQGGIVLVHRTAISQVLNHNCSLRFYRSDDGGASYQLMSYINGPTAATYPALGDRDLRDPSLFVLPDGRLAFKALVRTETNSVRDSNVDSITVEGISSDGGHTWSPLTPIAPSTWSFWRVRQHAGSYYAAAYEDGDLDVRLFSSPDGQTWTMGADVYNVSADTPLETELVFMPSGRLLALVRVDGNDNELLGNIGRLRTIVCWAMPPYDTFSCPQVLDGVRFDGPVAFFHGTRLFVIARRHFIEPQDRKRTALYELGGTLEGGPLTVIDHGDFPSAGDTAYAGAADIDADHVAVTWYSSDLVADQRWALAIFEPSDIRAATIDFTHIDSP